MLHTKGPTGKTRPDPRHRAASGKDTFYQEQERQQYQAGQQRPSNWRGIGMQKKRSQEIAAGEGGEHLCVQVNTGHLLEITVEKVDRRHMEILVFSQV